MNPRELALRALVTKHIADLAADAIKARRAELTEVLGNGDRYSITSPDDPGLDIGMVWRTKPKGAATITDRAAFTAWMAEHYPDRVDNTISINPEYHDLAIRVLQNAAPDVLTEIPTVESWAENEVIKLTEQARQPCGPGREMDVPGVAYEPPKPGTVTLKLADDGPAVIEHLWRTGRVNLATGEVLALPAGDPE